MSSVPSASPSSPPGSTGGSRPHGRDGLGGPVEPGGDKIAVERRLLDEFQRDFPLVPRPFAAVAERLGVDEATVLGMLARLQAEGVVSRVGAVVAPHAVGYSTLAAMRVPPEMLEGVAALVSSFPEVNHNYEREHRLNLWFVVAAASRERVRQVLAAIEYRTSLPVIDLPLVEAFRLDLGFRLR